MGAAEILNELREIAGQEDVIRNDLNEQDVKDTALRMVELFAMLDTMLSTGMDWPGEWVVPS